MIKYCEDCESDVTAELDNLWVVCPFCDELLMVSRTTEPELYTV